MSANEQDVADDWAAALSEQKGAKGGNGAYAKAEFQDLKDEGKPNGAGGSDWRSPQANPWSSVP